MVLQVERPPVEQPVKIKTVTSIITEPTWFPSIPQDFFPGLSKPPEENYAPNGISKEWRFNSKIQDYEYVGSDPAVLQAIEQETQEQTRMEIIQQEAARIWEEVYGKF